MQLDPYMHLQLHEQELRRTMAQNALIRAARENRGDAEGASRRPSARLRVAFRPLELAGIIAGFVVAAAIAVSGRLTGG